MFLRSFVFNAGSQKWCRLGGTMTLYFLQAYHYGLLSLTCQPSYHYPGIVIPGLPATLEGIKIRDQENFILEPFVKATARESLRSAQVIVAGSAFF